MATCKPGASVTFGSVGEIGLSASICGFEPKLPSIPFPPVFSLPFEFPPPLPKLKLAWSLTCDPSKPIDITAGIEWGGGRVGCQDDDPDQQEAA